MAGSLGPELPAVLALADVVVSRSSAGTLAELCCCPPRPADGTGAGLSAVAAAR
jgi:hypothetical protein